MSRPGAASAARVKRSASAPYLSISSSGSMTLPLDFDIFWPALVAHQGVDVDGAERHIAHEVQAHHHHAGDPEEDDVEAGDQHVGRVVALQLRRLLRPAERRERPQRRREPGVEHVGIAPQRDILAVVLARQLPCAAASSSVDEDVAVRPVPRRDLMAPPELARDAPGLDVAHPVEEGLLPVLAARTRCVPSSTALIAGFASVAALTYHWSVSHGSIGTPERSPCGTVCVWSSIFSSRPSASRSRDHRLARREAVEAAIGRRRVVVQVRVGGRRC